MFVFMNEDWCIYALHNYLVLIGSCSFRCYLDVKEGTSA